MLTPPYRDFYPTLSLLQPWASLLALGVKRIETRTWGTSFRGWMAIHASMGKLKPLEEIIASEPFRSTLLLCDVDQVGELPRGQVVGVARLADCVQIDRHFQDRHPDWLSGQEQYFGNFAAGRWAWLFESPWIAQGGLNAKGQLGVW